MSIHGLFDTDIYKITMQYAVLRLFAGSQVEYDFINRRKTDILSDDLLKKLQLIVNSVGDMKADTGEINHLRKHLPFLPDWYTLGWLKNFVPNPKHVQISKEGIKVKGPWEEAIWWEVPLLYTISELFCAEKDAKDPLCLEQNIKTETLKKIIRLSGEDPCQFMQFGTRRRRSYEIEDKVIQVMKNSGLPNFMGVSNVHFAAKYDLKPMGTMGHEWIMAISALKSLRYANRYAMEAWNEVYGGNLGVFLSDTFGTEAFLKDFNSDYARRYDATRQDSGDPYVYGNRLIGHYNSLNIDPKTKGVAFSNGLNTEETLSIQNYFRNKVKRTFGIGTHFTNDFDNRPSMNIVMKLTKVNGIPLVKLSDDAGKASGDANAIKEAKYVFLNEPLV